MGGDRALSRALISLATVASPPSHVYSLCSGSRLASHQHLIAAHSVALRGCVFMTFSLKIQSILSPMMFSNVLGPLRLLVLNQAPEEDA